MKRIFRYYVIPVEFFTRERRHKVEAAWVDHLSPSSINEFSTFFLIADDTPTKYSLPVGWPIGTVFFDSTGGCIVLVEQADNWNISEDNIVNELANRANRHTDLIDFESQQWLNILIETARSATCGDDFPVPDISYVFGFYLIESDEEIGLEDRKLIKILAEPSIVGIDDMKPCVNPVRLALAVETKEGFLDQIRDIDISSGCELYVTWATLVSVVKSPHLVEDTKDMLISLEARLQLVWNRCYRTSIFSDDIFRKNSSISDINKFYWSFVNSLDDAKSLLTSTLSSRASVVFDELVRTSRVAGEIDRLKDKVNLVEKYLNQQREKNSIKYQRTIETLLFITALSQVVPLFFESPVFNNHLIGGAVIGLTFILGLIAIFRR